VEYVSSALVDLDLHSQQGADDLDIDAFEQSALERIGMPAEIVMRHRPTHFAHIFSGDHYASAYYSYMWSEVLDADAFAAFEETGDIFDPATAKALHDHVYAAGGARDPEELYKAFRGRLPTPDALLRRRGPLAALTVPGAVAGWMLALDAAKAQGGRLPLADLLAAAIRHAREGFAVSRSLAAGIRASVAELQSVPGFGQTFLIDGKPPAE